MQPYAVGIYSEVLLQPHVRPWSEGDSSSYVLVWGRGMWFVDVNMHVEGTDVQQPDTTCMAWRLGA